MMLEEQGRKSLRLWLAGLKIRWFDPIAEASELPNHLPSAQLLRSFGDRWAPFFVTDSLVQDQLDQSTLSMGDGPDGLSVSQARDRAAIALTRSQELNSNPKVCTLVMNIGLRILRYASEAEDLPPAAARREDYWVSTRTSANFRKSWSKVASMPHWRELISSNICDILSTTRLLQTIPYVVLFPVDSIRE
jgi:hypothetical protein